ncbi:uncharacterized protein CELE_Y69A2AR.24 [Caenorhabditis elegans]|uniref:Uncharacterized protein n=1 Tax=Caenorhabditis elegans TaxID=6239 RepID=U4PS51_CAEEL|nr:Uncharacterized protein CELE_Y69A2AR.24 [Caenorhabditis elegans]CDH93415.1 Uncharacterized protein CELE_Y69A2AR.24 [Caenorhabditis elegans]|eukprot:NP_001294611.1 Uncharacterized protein CELE_Y69A2AR.24 [Caenorhabditis elegans]
MMTRLTRLVEQRKRRRIRRSSMKED